MKNIEGNLDNTVFRGFELSKERKVRLGVGFV
jgi:hypothetical protein